MTAEISAELLARIRLGDPTLCILSVRFPGHFTTTYFLAEDRGHRHYRTLVNLGKSLASYPIEVRAALIRLPHRTASRCLTK